MAVKQQRWEQKLHESLTYARHAAMDNLLMCRISRTRLASFINKSTCVIWAENWRWGVDVFLQHQERPLIYVKSQMLMIGIAAPIHVLRVARANTPGVTSTVARFS